MDPDIRENCSVERWLDSLADEFDRIAREMGDEFRAEELARDLRQRADRARRLGWLMWIVAISGVIWSLWTWPALLQTALAFCVAIFCQLRSRDYRVRAEYFEGIVAQFTGSTHRPDAATDTPPRQ